ncbi:MAG: ATP-binding protein [bacterium]|nr:ATP-binding protein [bacterium]
MEELSLHILDLVENSVAANCTWVSVRVIENSIANSYIVEIEDDGRGMSAETIVRVSDPFFTTRTTRKVGLGIPFLTIAAEQCQGRVEIVSTIGKGTCVSAYFERDHIDRAPLGDIAGTLVAIIAMHPDINLNYCHQIDARSFCLNSSEMREICGDDLSHPKIVGWLMEYIAENEHQLEVL